MRNKITFAFVSIFFIFNVNPSISQSGALESPPSGISSDKSVLSNTQAVLKEVRSIEERIEDKYASRLDAMKMERASFDNLVNAAWWLGGLLGIGALMAGVFFGNSVREIRKDISEQTNAKLSSLIESETEAGVSLARLTARASELYSSLEEMRKGLSGFEELRAVAKSASGFDPLMAYLSVDKEIDDRRLMLEAMMSGEKGVKVEDTTRDLAFRQRVSVIFEKLLEAVEQDKKTGYRRVSSTTCFNASAAASKMEFDFVSLALIKHGSEISAVYEPETQARFLRQKVEMGEVSRDGAIGALQEILIKTGEASHRIDLVVEEAGNIGRNLGCPVEIANLMQKALSGAALGTSYVSFHCSSLYRSGICSQDWELAETLFWRGLEALQNEPFTAVWYVKSWRQVAPRLELQPELLDAHEGKIRRMLGVSLTHRHFARKFGVDLTRSLLSAGCLEAFIASNSESENQEAQAEDESPPQPVH